MGSELDHQVEGTSGGSSEDAALRESHTPSYPDLSTESGVKMRPNSSQIGLLRPIIPTSPVTRPG